MTPKMAAAISKRETKLGALRPFRHMHAATQPNRVTNDCEEKRDSDEGHRSNRTEMKR